MSYFKMIVLIGLSLLVNACSILGGGFSHQSPLKMQKELSTNAQYLLDKAFDLKNSNSAENQALVDHHFHLIGSGQGIEKICPSVDISDIPPKAMKSSWINSNRFTLTHPMKYITTKVLMDSVKVKHKKDADKESVKRLLELVKSITNSDKKYNLKVHLLAVDGYYDSPTKDNFYVTKDSDKENYRTFRSSFNKKKTDLVISNWYTIKLAECLNDKVENSNPFVPVISINPYRKDALLRLDEFKEKARYIKWVAPSQGFNPANPRIKPFYEKVKELGMVIISHTGDEHAFNVKDKADRRLGNPLLMQNALDEGIPVILSHAGGDDEKDYYGESLDEYSDKKHVAKHKRGPALSHQYRNHWNFMKMMMDKRNEDKWCLFGDISALTIDKNFQHFKALMGPKKNWLQYRLLYGSDYPLIATRTLFPLKKLIEQGYIHSSLEASLEEIFSYNPLAFDIVLKRNLNHPDSGDWLSYLPQETFMSLEENIRREKKAENFTGVKRQACFNWFQKMNIETDSNKDEKES